ncbi:hypothetical protein AMATHDRAFT_40325 [Amanita thiersii Skay4041]|uniref:Peptidase M20 domain-containing protein 2 n=1 Tax=Amanita thiersii Skay4041 TaxID=703135 RepID=A0A2A9NS77_9AGAR|nr:hypothetical protein AMATHDRAFT_40325 [Amanita thiersii Skay4041]
MSFIPRNLQVEKSEHAESNDPGIYRLDILDFIDKTIVSLSGDLQAISLGIHDHPELKFEEHYAHDILTEYMEKQGFEVEKCPFPDLDTAWRATFSYGIGGRTVGINSEMDALPKIGHGCGHNLIAVGGVAVACALKAVMQHFKISGRIVLLGTPGEEGGRGKIILLQKDAYKDMDVCLMCHPSSGPGLSVSFGSSLAATGLAVEYHGQIAGAISWKGRNALDAAVLAYSNISTFRQQLKPTHRVHGIIEGKKWPNDNYPSMYCCSHIGLAVPDYSKVRFSVRAPAVVELVDTLEHVEACLRAAAIATGCKITYVPRYPDAPLMELWQNKILGDEVGKVITHNHGSVEIEKGTPGASTDFGNVTHVLPALHANFAIPTVPNGGNHTAEFTKAAKTPAAHKACFAISIALAAAGSRFLLDDRFFADVRAAFEEDRKKGQGFDGWTPSS